MEQEIWEDIIGYEKLYSVSNLGRIRRNIHWYNTPKDGILKNIVDHYGYLTIGLNKNNVRKGFYVHLLVAQAFLDPKPDGFECNHKDGNKANPNISNLEYLMPKENTQHAWKKGKCHPAKGVDINFSKLTEKQVIEIRNTYQQGNVSYGNIAKKYSIDKSTIGKIISRKIWKHI